MDLSADHILVVFLLTTLAGLATGIGGFIAFFMKRTDTKALTFALGLSGGVMVYISLVELLGEAQHRLMSPQAIRQVPGSPLLPSSGELPWRL